MPWTAEEINLPDRQMPRKLYMAIFDLSPLLELSGVDMDKPPLESIKELRESSTHRPAPAGAERRAPPPDASATPSEPVEGAHDQPPEAPPEAAD